MNARQIHRMLIGLLLLAAACGGAASSTQATATPDLFPTVAPFPTVARLATVAPLPTIAPKQTAAPTTAAPPSSGGGFIDHYVMAAGVQGSTYDPIGETTVFTSNQTFHLVVAIKAAPDGTKYKVKWYADGATPTSLGEYELSSSGTRNLDFTYKPPARGAAEGAYHIELYENGNLVDNIPFSVSQAANDNTATATPVAVQVGFIDQVVLAKDVEPDTYKPIDVTTAFSPGDPYIHFVVHLNEAPAQTKLTVTLLQDDIIELKTLSVMTPDSGSRFADFSFTPPDGGWEMGDYSMVLYVNDQLNQSVAFSVK